MNTDDHFEEQPEDNNLSRTNEFRPKEFSAFIGGFSDEQFKGIQKSLASVVVPSINPITQNCIPESTLRSITSTVAPSINSVAQRCASLFASAFDDLAIRSDLLAGIDFSSFKFSSETWEKFSEAAHHAIRDIEAEGEKARRGASPDFANNAGACKRFVEWFETSPFTKGKSGKPTYKKLANLVGVTDKTAKKFINEPERITNQFASKLRKAIGEEAYLNIVHGEEGRKKIIAEREKEEKIKRFLDAIRELETEQAIEVLDWVFSHRNLPKQTETFSS